MVSNDEFLIFIFYLIIGWRSNFLLKQKDILVKNVLEVNQILYLLY